MTGEEALKEVMNIVVLIVEEKALLPIQELMILEDLCDQMRLHQIEKTNNEETLEKIENFLWDLRGRKLLPPVVQ